MKDGQKEGKLVFLFMKRGVTKDLAREIRD
jgi:hypothetical protein